MKVSEFQTYIGHFEALCGFRPKKVLMNPADWDEIVNEGFPGLDLTGDLEISGVLVEHSDKIEYGLLKVK